MRYLLLILITLAGLSSAFAQTVGKQLEFNSAWGIQFESNLVKNPSAAKNTLGTTTSSATVTRDTTSTLRIDGKASFAIDTSSNGGYVEFTLLTPSSEQTEGNCGFTGVFKGDGTLYSAQLLDGSSNVLTSTQLTNESAWRQFRMWYPCGASGARKVRITQTTAGTSPAINVGRLFYGRMEPGAGTPVNTFSAVVNSAGNIPSLGGSQDWITNSCTISPTGTFTCPLKSGLFSVGPSCVATLQGSSSSDQTVARVTAASTTSVVVNTTTGAGTGANIAFNLVCVKQGADFIQPAITPDLVTQRWNGNIAGNGWTTTSTATFADFSAGTSISVTTLSSIGLSCAAISGSLPGLTCSNAIVGASYNICSTFSGYDSATSNTILFALYDGAGTAISSGNGGDVSGATKSLPFTICGQLTATSNSFDVKIRGRQATAGTLTLDNNSYPKHFTISQITAVGNYPILVGGMTTRSTSAMGDEWVNGNCTSSSSVNSSSTSGWSISNITGGACTITFPYTFASTPYCTWGINESPNAGASSLYSVAATDFPTTSSITLRFKNYASGTVTDFGSGKFSLRCIGPR